MTKKAHPQKQRRQGRRKKATGAMRSDQTAQGMRAQAARVRALGYEPRAIVAQFTDGPRKIDCDLKALYTAHSADLYAALGRAPSPEEVIASGGQFAELFDTLTETNRRRYIKQAIDLAGGPAHPEGGVSSRLRAGGFKASGARGNELLGGVRNAANNGQQPPEPRGAGAGADMARQPDPFLRQQIEVAKKLQREGYFEPASLKDERDRRLREIVQRKGEPKFRRALIAAYNGCCAVTHCDAVDALEACHITPYLGPKSNRVSNGLLLRADIHTLFDLDLIGIDPISLRVVLADQLQGTSYQILDGVELSAPDDGAVRPSRKALQQRWKRFRRAALRGE